MTERQDGLERLRRWHDEQRGVPPAVGRFGARLTALALGSTTLHLPVTDELLLPGGVPTDALAALLADMSLSSSVVASLPDLRGVATAVLAIDHLGLPPVTGALLATGMAAPYRDGAPSHCTGTVRSQDGTVVATASGWFLASPAPPGERERTGLVLEPAAPSLLALLDVSGGNQFRLHVREALSNALGTLHGGVGALAAALAAGACVPAGMRPVSSRFTFLRPSPRHGSVTVTGRSVRQGRRTAVAEAELSADDGTVVLTASLLAAHC